MPGKVEVVNFPELLKVTGNEGIWAWMKQGKVFISSDADQNDLVLGQTSFANTTPTFLLHVPANVIAVPLSVSLGQAGTVAGGDISVHIEIDEVTRWSTGGTAEKVFRPYVFPHEGPSISQCTLYTNPTAVAGYGIKIWGTVVGPDVSTAEGAINNPDWVSDLPYMLKGPAAFLVYTYAATTGPSWDWNVKWLELKEADL